MPLVSPSCSSPQLLLAIIPYIFPPSATLSGIRPPICAPDAQCLERDPLGEADPERSHWDLDPPESAPKEDYQEALCSQHLAHWQVSPAPLAPLRIAPRIDNSILSAAGQSGLGKTTFFNTLFDKELLLKTERSFEERKEQKITQDTFGL